MLLSLNLFPAFPKFMSISEASSPVSDLSALPGQQSSLLQQASSRRGVVQQRLQKQWPVLRDRLSRLYGHQPNFSGWLTDLVSMAVEHAINRPADLWQLDLQRESAPDWHLQGLGYCAYVDKFGRTLRGVADRIPYLQELGVTYLHLLPFLKPGSPPNDGGFAVASYAETDPRFGSVEDLQALTRELRQAGISLCSDLVLNHVSNEHEWAIKARAGDPLYRSFFHWETSAQAVQAHEQHLHQIFPGTAPGNFTYIDEQKAWVWTTFYPYQWDLNYAQPKVFTEMSRALLGLANLGVESFRLDSTGYLWKREGTNCINRPEVHHILQALRCLVNIAAPGVLLKAEAIMPTQDLPPYFGMQAPRAPECHLAYHSSLMASSWLALCDEKTEVLQRVLQHTPPLPEGCGWMTYVRCHDDIGWNILRPELQELGADVHSRLRHASQFFAGLTPGSYGKGATFQAAHQDAVHGTNGMTAALAGLDLNAPQAMQDLAISRMVLMQSLSLLVGGIPLIYMGDEIAQGNTPQDELSLRCGPDGRELQRPDFDWSAYDTRHQNTAAGRLYQQLQAFLHARRQLVRAQPRAALHVLTTSAPSLLALQRGEDVLGLFNFSHEPIALDEHTLQVPLGTVYDNLLTHQAVHLTGLTLKPYDVLWLQSSQVTRSIP